MHCTRIAFKWVFLAIWVILPTGFCSDARGKSAGEPEALKLQGDTEYTHDPSIAKDGNTWYLFGTANGSVRKGELPIRCSNDLHHWQLCGYVFDSIPDWIKKQSPLTKELWDPDISYFDSEYHLYYAFSFSGRTRPESRFSQIKSLTRKVPITIGSTKD